MRINNINNFNFKGDLNKPYLRSEDNFGMHQEYIYQVKNKINGDSFIGNTENPEAKRENIARGYNVSAKTLRKAIQKFGIENFSFKVIDFADDSLDLKRKKRTIMDSIQPSYNKKGAISIITIGADGNITEYKRLMDYKDLGLLKKYYSDNNEIAGTNKKDLKIIHGEVVLNKASYDKLSKKEKAQLIQDAKDRIDDNSIIFVDHGQIKTFLTEKDLRKETGLAFQTIKSILNGEKEGYQIFRKAYFKSLDDSKKQEIIDNSYVKLSEIEGTNSRPTIDLNQYFLIDKNGVVKRASELHDKIDEIKANNDKIYNTLHKNNYIALNRAWIKDNKYKSMTEKERKTFLLNAINSLREEDIYITYRNNGGYVHCNNAKEAAELLNLPVETINRHRDNFSYVASGDCYITAWKHLHFFYKEIYKQEMKEIESHFKHIETLI